MLTDEQIVTAYARAYLNIRNNNKKNLIEHIHSLVSEYEEEIKILENDHENDDENDDEMDQSDSNYVKDLKVLTANLNRILEVLSIPEDAVMLNKIRAVKRGEEPGPVSKNSNHLGFPDPAIKNIMSLMHDPLYFKNVSANPKPHPILGADWNTNSSSSSSSDNLISTTKMKGKRTRDDSSSNSSNKYRRRNEDTDDDDMTDVDTNLKTRGGRKTRKLRSRKLRRTMRK